jgi:aspartyl protease family protein
VDTGATAVTLGIDLAQTLGIHYKSGQAIKAQTANGVVTGYLVNLDSVRVGAVTLYQVEAFVSPAPMRSMVLLGNSFLSRFDMQQAGGQLILESRY